MPTVEEFEQAARLLDEAETGARGLVRPIDAAMGPQVFSGGRLTDSIDAAIGRATADANGLANDLGGLADECRARAAAVAAAAAAAAAYAQASAAFRTDSADYDEALAAHEADPTTPHPGRPPTRPAAPPAPPPWADF